MKIFWLGTGLLLMLAACSSTPRVASSKSPRPAATAKGGGYYLDDGPGENPPPNLDAIPDAVPRREPLHRYANNPYQALGQTYTPVTTCKAYREEGLASWYGRRFHGKRTSSGEPYDMYAMTGAHRTLPIPSYARVTALDSGKSVVVRINDRGPFHSERLIDLSYAAAYKLGYAGKGNGRVRVESIDPAQYDVGGDPLPRGLYLQIGAFAKPDNAHKMRDRVEASREASVPPAYVVLNGKLHRVAVGPFASEADAASAIAHFRERLGVQPVKVVR